MHYFPDNFPHKKRLQSSVIYQIIVPCIFIHSQCTYDGQWHWGPCNKNGQTAFKIISYQRNITFFSHRVVLQNVFYVTVFETWLFTYIKQNPWILRAVHYSIPLCEQNNRADPIYFSHGNKQLKESPQECFVSWKVWIFTRMRSSKHQQTSACNPMFISCNLQLCVSWFSEYKTFLTAQDCAILACIFQTPHFYICNNSVLQDKLIMLCYLTEKYVFHNCITNSSARTE